MRFFPKFTKDNVLALTPQQTRYYLQAMEQLKARERLYLMDALQYPIMGDRDKRKKHRKIYKDAYPDNFKTENTPKKTTDLELF